MNDKDRLAELFKQFPGIGPRQAKRMVYFLLMANKSMVDDVSRLIKNVQENISVCSVCFRYFEKNKLNKTVEQVCSICNNSNRNMETLMIVARDVDFETIEKSGVYKGMYFVLGGTIPFLSNNYEKIVRTKELIKVLPKRLEDGLKEIIFALNATPEGEHTTNIIEKSVKQYLNEYEKNNPDNAVVISKLGRGFSTGTEVEYSDKETIKNAISSRFLS